jgi:hydrogenase nickel incorporation protein HypA/HybF
MHESGVIHNLVHRLEAAARDAGAERVSGVTVCLGALSQMSADHFRAHFAAEVLGTIAEDAILTLEVADDPAAPDAQSVVLRSVELEIEQQ